MKSISHSEIGLMLTLDVLLQERSVSRAAKILGITQPALSARLARLREMFGDPLLIPTGRGMTPSDRAMALADPLHSLLGQLVGLVREKQMFRPEESERTFVIAATDYSHQAIMSQIIKGVRAAAPKIMLVFIPLVPDRLTAGLETSQIDFVIASKSMVPEKMRASILFREHHVMVQRKGHPRGSSALDMETYCALDHVSMSSDGLFRHLIDNFLETHGRRRHVVVSLPSYGSVPTLIASTDLVITVPRRVALSFNTAVEIYDLPLPPPSFTYMIAWHERSQADAGSKWLRERVVRLFAKDP